MQTDPIADMLTRIRNANKALLDALGMPFARDGRPAGFESLNDQAVAA